METTKPLAKFIEFIEEIIADGDWEHGDGTPMTEDAKAVLRAIPKWIAVEERLPGMNVSVLIYDQDLEMCYVGINFDARWWYGDHYGRWDARVTEGDITHWMPLPSSP